MVSFPELSERAELQHGQSACNLAVWEEGLKEPYFRSVDGRIETI